MAKESENPTEDRRQPGGCRIAMGMSSEGPSYVQYMLLVRRAPVWRAAMRPIAMLVRSYEDGNLTLTESTWEA